MNGVDDPPANPASVGGRVGPWRKNPPTRDEVLACPWWWTRSATSRLRVLKLLTCYDDAEAIVYDESSARFRPQDWGADADWAPCLPPPGSGK